VAVSYSQWASRIRIPSGFVFGVLFLATAEPRPETLVAGCAVAALGLALRAAAAGVIEKNKRLAISGPYAYTRNPLYLGSAIITLGFSLASGNWWFAALLMGFFAAVYVPVMRSEEARLRQLFGEQYAAYAENVPLLIPRATPWRPAGAERVPFEWRRYLSNHEYRAGEAFVLITLILLAKLLWFK
jgi:protein-S-isoprenylcysteine O-methyltransferase Ste14